MSVEVVSVEQTTIEIASEDRAAVGMPRTARANGTAQADRAMARTLGFASLAIGLLELVAPDRVEWLLGLPEKRHTGVIQTLGVRELLHGVDLLSHPDDPRPGVFARVAGDGLDGAMLMAAARETRHPARFAATCGLVLGVVAMDLTLARRLWRQGRPS